MPWQYKFSHVNAEKASHYCLGFCLLPCPPPPGFTFNSVQTVQSRIPRGVKQGKIRFPEKTCPQHCVGLGWLFEKLECCFITTCLCHYFPVLSLEIALRNVRILIVLIHADTFKTNQHWKHFVSIWTNYFFTTNVNRQGQYVMGRLLIYTGFVNDVDLLKHHCSICLFQPDSLWAEIGGVKSRRPVLMVYCKHANYIVLIINRNYSFNWLLVFLFMLLFTLKFHIK